VAAVSDRRSQAAIAFIVGTMALYLGRSDAALAYVKVGLQPLLVGSGVLLLGLALAAVVGHGSDEHGHPPHGPRVAWLLALPPLALVLIAPPALGAFAASRQPIRPPPVIHPRPTGSSGPAAATSGDSFPPLIPPGDGTAVPMALGEYLARDYEEPYTLAGVRIRLVGFVTPEHGGRDGYLLTRFAISCCAADATALRVAIRGDPVVRAPDTWLEVEGHWQQHTSDHSNQPASDTAVLLAESVRTIKQPSKPYEPGPPF
jgi:uncharacterized repeat protein (TIGR03943 family)